MGYSLTLVYIVLSFLTPGLLLGPVAQLRPELFLVVLAMLVSLPAVFESNVLKAPQTIAIVGMSFAVITSVFSIGGFSAYSSAAESFYGFMQPAFLFFLVAANCKTKRQLQGIIFALCCSSFIFIFLGFTDLRQHVVPSLYLHGDGDLRRLRGLGFVNDPNDFSQFIVSLLPCLFLWYKKSWLTDFFFVFVPLAILLFGMFLTHSRGALLALIAVLFLAFRRKIGTVPAMVAAGVLLAGILAVGWSGGRDISMDSGTDRLDLWSGGLQLLKTHPLFGVGLNRFAEYEGLTAHNTIVVCAAELGTFGFFFWVLFVYSSIRGGLRLSGSPATPPDSLPAEFSPWTASSAADQHLQTTTMAHQPQIWSATHHASASQSDGALPVHAITAGTSSHMKVGGHPFVIARARESAEEISRMSRLLLYALSGMLTAGWFLSRAYSQWLFMYCGMMYAVVRMAESKEVAATRDPLPSLLRWTAVIAVTLLALVYVTLRYRTLTHS